MKWLYKITNGISGKLYIGVSIDPERRWNQHRTLNSRASALKDAIAKYGSDNFTFKLLVCGEDDYIDELEVEAIQLYNTQVPNGYNITLGGDGTTLRYWSESWNSLLGTMPDIELAEQVGSTIHIVSARRNGAGIPSYAESNKIDWSLYDKLLGTDSDINIANKVNISSSSISKRREVLGIPRYSFEIPKEAEAMLGKQSDPYIADNFNIPLSTVKTKRRNAGIPQVKQGSWVNKRSWTEEEIASLKNEELTTNILSEILGLSKTTIRNKRRELGVKYNRVGKRDKYPLTEKLIKELSDPSLTYKYFKKEYGMSSCTLTRKRKELLQKEETSNEKEE